MAPHFRRGELPAARGLLCEIGEVFAGAWRIERCAGDVPRGIDLNAHTDADHTLNGGAGLLGDIGQNLVEDFTARGR